MGGADGAEDGHLEDQRHQFGVQVSDAAFCVGEAYQLLGDIGVPLDAPGVVLAAFVWVYPDPPRRPGPKCWCSRGQMRASGAVCNLDTQAAPELDVWMELGGEVGRRPLCNSDAGEGDLHRVEVPDGPMYCELHGEELVNEALQLLDRHAPLAIGYLQKVY